MALQGWIEASVPVAVVDNAVPMYVALTMAKSTNKSEDIMNVPGAFKGEQEELSMTQSIANIT